ncbi:hypothetical protein PGT21_014143 [Puccinia graminis f. sp. tritici]|uniref:Uncharacterized protein n=1 Tax=Puccinia graminis f. sp. tritici TaxID=56615 RepID=A0A5B0MMW6_PUCGR|nr:hypothetical protein PGT21_014143 [Puccinia graminis f. sp. tritici]
MFHGIHDLAFQRPNQALLDHFAKHYLEDERKDVSRCTSYRSSWDRTDVINLDEDVFLAINNKICHGLC